MKLYKIFLVIFLAINTSWVVCAQEVTSFYHQPNRPEEGIGLRLGINNSFPTVTAAVVKSPLFTTYLGGIVPRFGYYIGGFFYKDLSPNQLTFRLDATLQMKGVGADYNGKPVVTARYYYLGLTPLIGLHLTNYLTVYTGAEANLMVAKQNAWGKGYPLELGTTIRLTYAIGQFSAEIGYFRGFTKLDRSEIFNLPGGVNIIDVKEKDCKH